MEPPSPARLYATVAGAVLFLAGLFGFFEDLSWLNFVHAGSGALALLLAGAAARPLALCLGVAYTALAILAFGDDGWLHLGLGVLGIAACIGTPSQMRGSKPMRTVENEPRKNSDGSEPRAQAAGKSA